MYNGIKNKKVLRNISYKKVKRLYYKDYKHY